MKTIIKFKSYRFPLVVLIIISLIMFQACNSSKSVKGGAVGAAAGGAIGGIIGKNNDNTAAGAIIGAAIGGAAGTLIGKYMDRQAEEMEEELEGAEVTRVGEGILLTFDSGLLFEFDSYQLTAETRSNLLELADILNEYEETEILIEGHTDSKGSESYNMQLSKQRAGSVADFLIRQGVQRDRFAINGWGEERPVADNDTSAGRRQNRRVEVAVYADDDLKQDAKDGTLETN